MTILWASGFDDYSTSTNQVMGLFDGFGATNNGYALQANTCSQTPYGIGKSLVLSTNATLELDKAFISNATNGVGFSFHMYRNLIGVSASTLNIYIVDGTTTQCIIGMAGDDSVRIWANTAIVTPAVMGGFGGNGSPTTSYSAQFTNQTWASFQFNIVFGLEGTGTISMRKNGSNTNAFTWSGRTQMSGNNSANKFILMTGSYSGGSNTEFLVDNLCFQDGTSWIPEVSIIPSTPNASVQSQFTVVGAASNWQAINNGTSEASYIQSNIVGNQDIFTLNTVSTNSTVLGYVITSIMEKSDGGNRTVTFGANVSGTLSNVANISGIGASWGVFTVPVTSNVAPTQASISISV